MSLAKSISTVDNEPILLTPPSFELLEELENMIRDQFNLIPIGNDRIEKLLINAQEVYKGPQTLRNFLDNLSDTIFKKYFYGKINEHPYHYYKLLSTKTDFVIKTVLKLAS